MTHCPKCGSCAINDDPERILCDRCLRDKEIERLREVIRVLRHRQWASLVVPLHGTDEMRKEFTEETKRLIFGEQAP